MSIDWIEVKSQLAPGLSPVNAIITILLLIISWPFALLMIAYIFKGDAIGLDLRYPSTYKPAVLKLIDLGKDLFARFKGEPSSSSNSGASTSRSAGGTPSRSEVDFEKWRSDETAKLKRERAELEREKMLFEASKKASEEKSH